MSVRLAWLTDLHLDFLTPAEQVNFHARVRAAGADALLVGGDISHALRVTRDLMRLQQAVEKPVYFVLGNHDYYGGSIAKVRAAVSRLCSEHQELRWLPELGVVALSASTALIGHDGWGDARIGAVDHAVVLNDEYHIDELKVADRFLLQTKLRALGEQAAAHIRLVLTEAVAQYREILLLTHVPPFREACWHNGATSGEEWLPRFTCAAVGEVVREIMSSHPDRDLTVYCGHSHGEGYVEVLPNLRVWTGGAEYG
ncbi:MAG: metallophosphoesterase, partial [Bryobacteraceae bacterium]|nr:metallophosphoesterase [Bryobacteraceae bacterium]